MGVITGSTRLLGVIGHPIEHSLSPLMHNAALQAMAQGQGAWTSLESSQSILSHVYLPLAVAPTHLKVAVDGLAALGWVGFNITIPHKQTIVPLLSEVTPLAKAVGAVNTVWRTAQGWTGTNTDVQGFLAPLLTQNRDWSGVEATILGSGGAARAVIVGCAKLGCANIRVIGRDRTKLTQLQASFAGAAVPMAIPIKTSTWDRLSHHLPSTELLVNTTPLGLSPHSENTPLTDEQIQQLPPTALVYDLIYTPDPTRLMQQAQAWGLDSLSGLEMLIQQGAAALEIWLQDPPPVAVMRQAAQAFLR
ncbi:shikimate dehydrogenase [Synechococcales cyanobacterium C]|uniref:Shikimate dehydrogenase (NADP(+)) n=1 Tax=Petrachloros mirabilis ULC683 TaxID=2781853 RepID=A0A8K1ZZ42_9CYAN|nr:shikimate dehydrogenase [Petrachloros mirabilis]NCJ07829.1 shikimate dehydrogenase [Petrachloros mirabilis ULC683]